MTLQLNTYQKRARELSKVTGSNTPHFWAIWALGLAGESGEVADHFKKALRDDNSVITPARRAAIADELGDVLWYVGRLASAAGYTLEEIAVLNIDKLQNIRRQKNIPEELTNDQE